LFSGGRLQVESILVVLTSADHMLTVEWTAAKGWSAASILPYQNLSLDPATVVFHYGFECFEGLKAYKVVKKFYLFLMEGQGWQDSIVSPR